MIRSPALLPPDRSTPLVIGHRGAPGYRPEHTRSSYELAVAQGAGAIEPDVVLSRDGVPVVRHENEIGGSTDVADHAKFAGRRTTKAVDGEAVTGWFTEDFDWAELSTLRAREPRPGIRSTAFDDAEPILRLADVLAIAAVGGVTPVVEVKHATYFAQRGFDLAAAVAGELDAAGFGGGRHPLVVESFEPGVLDRLRALGVAADYVFLLTPVGAPADLVAADGDRATPYAWFETPAGLDRLVGRFAGISVDRWSILRPDDAGAPTGPGSLVDDAHERGLAVFTYTARAENAFLLPPFRSSDDPAAIGDYGAEWAVIRDAGVDGVFVDQPDLGVAVFGAREARR